MTQPAAHWAVAQLPLAGEPEAGDQYLVKATPSGVLIAVADGLGHGSKAAQAARTAITTADCSSHEPLPAIVRRCHDALLRTRGAVMALASADTATRTLVWLGVGNILAVLVRGGPRRAPPREWLTCRSGTVGYRLPAVLRPSATSLDPGDLLVLATDGIQDGFAEDIDPAWEPQHAANHVLSRWARGGGRRAGPGRALSLRHQQERDEDRQLQRAPRSGTTESGVPGGTRPVPAGGRRTGSA